MCFTLESPKCYIFTGNNQSKRSAKGIPKKCPLEVEDFKSALYHNTSKSVRFGQIQMNKAFDSATSRYCERRALNALYFKFHLNEDGVNCRPHMKDGKYV